MDAEIWQTIHEILKTKIDQTKFKMWIDPLKASIDGDRLIITCPNKMMKNYIEKFFFKDFISAFSSLETSGSLVFSVAGEANHPLKSTNQSVDKTVINSADEIVKTVENLKNTREKDQNITSDQKIISRQGSKTSKTNHIKMYNRDNSSVEDGEKYVSLMRTKTFSNFVSGDSNSMAFGAAKSVAAAPGLNNQFNPLIILGQSGLGKTHLLYALGNEICKRHGNLNVVYVHANQFLRDFTALLSSKLGNKGPQIESLHKFYSDADVLLMDDIQFIATGEKTQEQIFNIINGLYENLKQIVITCDTYPKEVKGLDNRIVSRLNQGIIAEINVPTIEERIKIIYSKAKESKLIFSDRIADYLAQAFRSNVREIEGAIKDIKMYCDCQDPSTKEPTIELVKDAVKGRVQSQERLITPDDVLVKVAETFRIQVKDLKGNKRYRTISYPRNLAMYIVREVTNKSYPEIGELFGGKHHTTVITACTKIRKGISSDRVMADDYHRIMELLNI